MKSKAVILALMLMCIATARAQLFVAVSPPKITGSKVIVPLTMENNLAEKVESARAAVFLMDEQGKVVGQTTKWVIGGSKEKPGLAAEATNAFYFVIALDKPLASTNLTTKVTFNRVVLEGGKISDPTKIVQVQYKR